METKAMTLEDFEQFCSQVEAQRKVCDEISQTKKQADQELERLEVQMLEHLHAMGRDSFQSKVGTFYVSHRMSVQTPKLPEEREAFFGYLRELGVFDTMITVNSQTLNAFYKEEFERAKEEGRGLEFGIPGIGEATIKETIGFRRAK